MKNILIPLAFAILLVCGMTCLYFISPQYRIQTLQNENAMLREQMAALQGQNENDLVALVIAGMLSLAVILLAAFFLLLCLLAKVRPADFFRVRTLQSLPQQETRPEIEREPTENISHHPVEADKFAYIWEG